MVIRHIYTNQKTLAIIMSIFLMCFCPLTASARNNKVGQTSTPLKDFQTESESRQVESVKIQDEILSEDSWESMQKKARAAGKELHLVQLPNYMIPLDADTFNERVLESQEAWLVVFHNGSLPGTWLTMMVPLEGIVWIGGSDVLKDKQIADQLEIDASDLPAFAVFSYGFKRGKKQWTITRDEAKAKRKALKSIPSRFHKYEREELSNTLLNIFMMSPSKFAAFLITDEEEVPSLFKALSVRFERYFDFHQLHQPSMDDLRSIGMTKLERELPVFMVMVVGGYKEQKPDITLVLFEQEKNGDLNFLNLLKFLYSVNKQYRHLIPGNHMADKEEILNMEDVMELENERFELLYGSNPLYLKNNKKNEKSEL